MTKALIACVMILILAGCANPRRIEPLPPIKSPHTSSQIFLKNIFTGTNEMRKLTFTLDNTPIYRFGETRQFSFYLDAGDYLFGYTHGSESCETDVRINPNGQYVFELGPECRITLISE